MPREYPYSRDIHGYSKTEVTARHMSSMLAQSAIHHRSRYPGAAPRVYSSHRIGPSNAEL